MPFRLKRTFRVFEKIIAVHLKKSNNENKRSSKNIKLVGLPK
jgi:hypothetical protein